MPWTEEGEQLAHVFAEKRGLTCYVFAGRMYVMDAGTRGLRNEEGWHYSDGASYREATREEEDLWSALGGPV